MLLAALGTAPLRACSCTPEGGLVVLAKEPTPESTVRHAVEEIETTFPKPPEFGDSLAPQLVRAAGEELRLKGDGML